MVRSSSAYALGELGDGRAIDALTQAQNDEDETVREEAAAALEKLGKKEISIAEDDGGGESKADFNAEIR